jgi:ribosomal protein L32E
MQSFNNKKTERNKTMKDTKKRNTLRKYQDRLYTSLIKRGYNDNDRIQLLRPDGYYYTVKDIKDYLIFGIDEITEIN